MKVIIPEWSGITFFSDDGQKVDRNGVLKDFSRLTAREVKSHDNTIQELKPSQEYLETAEKDLASESTTQGDSHSDNSRDLESGGEVALKL